jgi:glycosyltransferase involved in cell wall biosynthesis
MTIYNGYDAEFFKPHNSEKSNVFEIVNTGTILPVTHDVELFLNILYGLKDRMPKEEFGKLKISFYTPLSYRKLIIENPLYEGLMESFFFYDYVDTKLVAHILSKASVLLLLSNISQEEGPKGLESTTKFFEYLSVRKPILCVRSDEAGLEKAIGKLRVGCSARNSEQGISFLLDKFREWSSQGFTSQNSSYGAIQNYTREKQANQFENIFLSLLFEK